MRITFNTCNHVASAAFVDFCRDQQILIHELPCLEAWIHEFAIRALDEWPEDAHEVKLVWVVAARGVPRLPSLVAEIRRYVASGLPCELTAQFLQVVERSVLGAMN